MFFVVRLPYPRHAEFPTKTHTHSLTHSTEMYFFSFYSHFIFIGTWLGGTSSNTAVVTCRYDAFVADVFHAEECLTVLSERLQFFRDTEVSAKPWDRHYPVAFASEPVHFSIRRKCSHPQ